MTDIDDILNEREKTHGKYARVATRFKAIYDAVFGDYKDNKFDSNQLLAMLMIIGKQARIMEGDADFIDHWRDMAGYPQLVVKELENALDTRMHEVLRGKLCHPDIVRMCEELLEPKKVDTVGFGVCSRNLTRAPLS